MVGAGQVLVVDDDHVMREVLAEAVHEAGYGCTAVPDADEARDELARENFVAVLCDMMMPGETGFSLVAFIRRQYPDLPVLVVTGIADLSLTQRTLDLGAVACIAKPFEPDQVVAELGRVLS